MESVGVFGIVVYIVGFVLVVSFAIGSFFALPMIWFHVGHVSRKLDKVIKLLEDKKEAAGK